MDLDTAICIILTNIMKLLIHNLFSVLQIIILHVLSVISRVAPSVLFQYEVVLHVGLYFSRFQSEWQQFIWENSKCGSSQNIQVGIWYLRETCCPTLSKMLVLHNSRFQREICVCFHGETSSLQSRVQPQTKYPRTIIPISTTNVRIYLMIHFR